MTLLIIFLDSLFGGTNTPLVKYTVLKLAPAEVAFFRFFIASLILLPLALKSKTVVISFIKKDLLLSNLLFSANILIFVYAIQHTSIIMAQLFYLLAAPFVAILGYFFLKEKLSHKQILGLILAISGLLVLFEGSIKTKDILSFGTPIGNSLVFTGVIVWSSYIVYSRKISKSYSPFVQTFYNFSITSVLALLAVLFTSNVQQITSSLKTDIYIALLSLSLFSTVLFFFLYQWVIKHTSAFTSSLVNYLATFVAGFFAVLFFDEKLTRNFIFGAVLILAGVYLASSYNKKAVLSLLK